MRFGKANTLLVNTTQQSLYPVATRILLVATGLLILGFGVKLGSFTLNAFYPLVFLLAAALLFVGGYLLLESTKRFTISPEYFSLSTLLKTQVYPKEEVLDFVDVLLPTTKPRRKTRQLRILLQSGKKVTIHSNAMGDQYQGIIAALKQAKYQELTRSEASDILKAHKRNYRRIGALICGFVAAWAGYQLMFTMLQINGNEMPEALWTGWIWLLVMLFALTGALYYLFWSKGYD